MKPKRRRFQRLAEQQKRSVPREIERDNCEHEVFALTKCVHPFGGESSRVQLDTMERGWIEMISRAFVILIETNVGRYKKGKERLSDFNFEEEKGKNVEESRLELETFYMQSKRSTN